MAFSEFPNPLAEALCPLNMQVQSIFILILSQHTFVKNYFSDIMLDAQFYILKIQWKIGSKNSPLHVATLPVAENLMNNLSWMM